MTGSRIISIFLFIFIIENAANAGNQEFSPNTSNSDNSVQILELLVQLKHYTKTKPYRKLGFTLHMLNVCSLHYYQKRSICEHLFAAEDYNFLLEPKDEEYADLSCRRITVDASEILRTPDSNTLSIQAFKCPNPYIYHIEPGGSTFSKFVLPFHFYVSAGVRPQTLIMHYQHVTDDSIISRIRPRLVILAFRVNELVEQHKQKMNEKYERLPEFYLKPFTEPKVERTVLSWNQIERNPQMAELSTISNQKIKNLTPFAKFRYTFNKMNVCSMIKEDRLNICDQVFNTPAYKADLKTWGKLACRRFRVTLNYLPDGDLRTLKSAAIECPNWTSGISFMLTSMYSKIGLIAFIQVHPFKTILPDAVIDKVITDNLKKVPKYLLN